MAIQNNVRKTSKKIEKAPKRDEVTRKILSYEDLDPALTIEEYPTYPNILRIPKKLYTEHNCWMKLDQ